MNRFIFAVILMFYGGFYDWNVTIAGILIMTAVLWHYWKKKPVYQKKRNIFTVIPLLLFGLQVVVSLWAVDWAYNLSGILRGIVILLWMYLCIQMEEQEQDQILQMLPDLGVLMTVVGIVSLPFPKINALFWMSERFGGVFQYANTCALFLLICSIVQIEQIIQSKQDVRTEQKILRNYKAWGILLMLLVGMLLTGSRSVLLLFLLWGIYHCVQSRTFRLYFLAGFVLFIIFAGVYILLSGSYQNVGRIFTLFTAGSTIYGRLLYLSDAVCMIGRHPFGLGYMGYYYIQGAEQTGVYTVRFVHNDFAQTALDYGIAALVLFAVYIGWHIFKGNQGRGKKELLVILCMASFMDFHMQYLSIMMLGVLLLDLKTGMERRKRNEVREDYFFLIVGVAALFYFTIPFAATYFHKIETAVSLFPIYTEAQMAWMEQAGTAEEAVIRADLILEHNNYVAQAYDYKAYAAVMKGDFAAACIYKDKVISLKRYDVAAYQSYDALLDDMLVLCQEDTEAKRYLLGKKAELPKLLKELEQITNPLAFNVRDVPEFEWEHEQQNSKGGILKKR